MNFAICKRILRRVVCGPVVFATIFASGTYWGQTANAQSNSIESVTVLEENQNSVTFDVLYSYSGDHGNNVFMSAIMARKGKELSAFGYRPGRVRRGRHRTRIVLSARQGEQELFSSDQVVFSMYVGGKQKFNQRIFAFSKTWTGPRATLGAVRPHTVVPAAKGMAPVAGGNVAIKHLEPNLQMPPNKGAESGAGGGPSAPIVQILPDGSVEIRYSNGAKRIRSGSCGETTISPDGMATTISCSQAQPPTPPAAPPDSAHNEWLATKNERLLGVIRKLVAFDEPSIQNYLAKEGSALSPYQRIDARIQVISILVPPAQ